jgi:hypothetical protein
MSEQEKFLMLSTSFGYDDCVQVTTETLRPSDMSKEDLQTCLDLIKEGSAVSVARAKTEFFNAMLVSTRRQDGEIVGVGVVKMQRPDYASRIASKAEYSFNEKMHEIGYVSVKKECEGHGHCQTILESLLSRFPNRPIFATTFSDPMKHILPKFGFVRKGKEWTGDCGDDVSLWIKETP